MRLKARPAPWAPSGHRTLAMDPELALSVALVGHLVVISRDDRVPAEPGTEDRLDDGFYFHGHGPSACVREASRPGSIVEIAGVFVARGVQRAEPAANVLPLTQIEVRANCSDHRFEMSGREPDLRVEPVQACAIIPELG